MRYKGFDLNLLIALDALIEERSVSRAADRLNMSQPAMSAALGRLRAYFDDPILGAHGKRMIPTARALTLQPMIRELLAQADDMMAVSAAFDPASSRRHFRIGASDYLATVIFSTLIPALERVAPGVTLEIEPPFVGQAAMLEQGEIDILLTPEEHVSPDHPVEHLIDEAYVVLGCAANPIFERTVTMDDFFAAGHVVTQIGRSDRSSFAEVNLRIYGSRRRIEVLAASFLLAPELVVGTSRLTVMQERLALAFSGRMAVRYAPLPFDFPVMREMIQYNRTRAADSGLRWMIERIKDATTHRRT